MSIKLQLFSKQFSGKREYRRYYLFAKKKFFHDLIGIEVIIIILNFISWVAYCVQEVPQYYSVWCQRLHFLLFCDFDVIFQVLQPKAIRGSWFWCSLWVALDSRCCWDAWRPIWTRLLTCSIKKKTVSLLRRAFRFQEEKFSSTNFRAEQSGGKKMPNRPKARSDYKAI